MSYGTNEVDKANACASAVRKMGVTVHGVYPNAKGLCLVFKHEGKRTEYNALWQDVRIEDAVAVAGTIIRKGA